MKRIRAWTGTAAALLSAHTGRTPVLLGCALLLAGCGAAPNESEHGVATATPVEEPPVEFTRGGDETAPERFGLGRAATPDEIEHVDIDVSADGTGLPPGSGTVAEGADVYAAKCAACHGPDGTGASADALVAEEDKHAFVDGDDPDAFGKRTVGNYWPYAPTLFDYVRRSMPFDRPGSLADEEVYAVVAWILWKNELIGENAVMDAATLPQIEMPARDRFLPDDRLTSTRVR